MTYDVIKGLCKKNKISVNKLEQELGLAKGSLCRIDVNKPSMEKVQKIADHFEVTVDYLMTGKEESEKKGNSLIAKNKMDIAKSLEQLLDDFVNSDEPLYFKDQEIGEDELRLLNNAIEAAMNLIGYRSKDNKK